MPKGKPNPNRNRNRNPDPNPNPSPSPNPKQVSRLLADDLSSLGDQLRACRRQLSEKSHECDALREAAAARGAHEGELHAANGGLPYPDP